MSAYRTIGGREPVVDAALKATGQLRYLDDIKLPGMLYAKVLFSPIAHGKIKSIHTERAMALPGVRAIATHENAPGTKYNSTTRFVMQKPIKNEVIFTDTVRFVGDRVAAVAADTPEIAAKALKLIEVEYEPLPSYITPAQALAPGAYPIHGGESNVVGTIRQNAGDVDAAFAQADLVFEDTYELPAVHHGAMETHAAIGLYDAAGRLTLMSPFQNSFGQRIQMAEVFGLPMSRIRVITTPLGGAFGGKLETTLEYVPCVLSMMTGRPVKLTYDRRESIIGTRTRHAATVTMKTGVMRDGTITAQQYHIVSNTGGYAGSAMNVLGAMSQKVFKTYKVPNVRYIGTPVYTNTPCAGAMRGYGSPQAYFAQQVQFKKIAEALHMDLYDLQMKNMVDPDGVDQRNQKPIGNPQPKACLRRAMELTKNWLPLPREDEEYRYGTGFAMGAHGSSAYGAHLDQTGAIIKMNDDGTCVVYAGIHEMGQSISSTIKMAVAEVLTLPMEHIALVAGDTDSCPWSLGDFSSRGAYVVSHAGKKAAESVAKRLKEEAALLLGGQAADYVLENACALCAKTGQKATFLQLMDHAQNVSHNDIICAETYAAPDAPGSYGAHVARVRVSKKTGKAEVIDYVAVHDLGRVLNRMSAEGQLEGAIQMVVGYALTEELTFDETGRCGNANLRKYHMPRAVDMPRIQIDFIERDEPTGTFGAKSLSECAVVPGAPAIVNALSDALQMELHSIPYRPARP